MNFTPNDIEQIKKHGLTVKEIEHQIAIFKQGLSYINLEEAASLTNGILRLSKTEKENCILFFESKRTSRSMVKFVPASGAATRMFKFLFTFLKEYNPKKESLNAYINRTKSNELYIFFVGLEKFPFYTIVSNKLNELYPNFATFSDGEQKVAFVKTMLDEQLLNYGFYPKGLLPFHKYKDHISTAFEEHLFEAALYNASNNVAKLHFTISEKHQDYFKEEFNRIQKIVEQKTQTKFEISYSYQSKKTDTIAVNLNNTPFRDSNHNLVFRPSGHGALLTNLNRLDADIIFIKNIDNVVVFKYEEEIAKYKKMLAGYLLQIQEQAFHYLKKIETKNLLPSEIISIAAFLRNTLMVKVSEDFEKYSVKYQIEYLYEKLNRPIRVCGMVKNEGEPGGGPFWVKDESFKSSLQIVESAQIDKKNKLQKNILKEATYFNPVDLVCGVKNYKGEKFDLQNYVDPKTAFISMKTKTGKNLKALELPGLWNGAMANWNTVFIEVPLVTFNPVKTVNDLLKPTHQVKE